MSASWTLAAAGFRRYSGYRLATAAGAFTNSTFGLIKASIMVATVGAAAGNVAGYDQRAASTFAWLTQALVAPVALFGWTELAQRIRTGDVAIDLCRPVDLQWQLLAADLGRAAFQLIPRGLPPILVGALTFGLALPGVGWCYPLGLLSATVGVAISFGCRFLVNLAAFWLIDIRGLNTFYVILSNLLCGMFVPVHWFPHWLAVAARLTPFPSLIQAPLDIVTGRVTGFAALGTFAVQLGWLAGVLLTGRMMLRLATRKVVVQGG